MYPLVLFEGEVVSSHELNPLAGGYLGQNATDSLGRGGPTVVLLLLLDQTLESLGPVVGAFFKHLGAHAQVLWHRFIPGEAMPRQFHFQVIQMVAVI